jgi:HAD superfamily hydrolase (TIGR01458 family)
VTIRPVEGLLLDIDGVLAISWRAIPGAPEALRRFRDAGIPFRLVTNTTTHTRERLANALSDAGIAVAADEIVTASAATAAYVREHHPGARVFLVASGDAPLEFEGIQLVTDEADVVVLGGLAEEDEGFPYGELNRAFRMVMDGAALVAMHRTRWWMTGEGPRLDSTAFLPAFEEAAGRAAALVGKPSPDFFRQALALLGVGPDRAVMVGDDVRTDVLAAQSLGMTGILVRTGKFREEDLRDLEGTPDIVADSIAEVPGLLGPR